MEKTEQVAVSLQSEPLLTTKEVALFAGVSEYTMSRYRMDGIGPNYIKLGPKMIRYRRSDVEEWVNKMMAKKVV